jgi:hypothetical protein
LGERKNLSGIFSRIAPAAQDRHGAIGRNSGRDNLALTKDLGPTSFRVGGRRLRRIGAIITAIYAENMLACAVNKR